MAEHNKKMSKTISYDKENDILVIHKGFSAEERFKGNIDAGDLIIDISTKERVRGIEVINASRFLKEFDIKRQVLENMSDANFNASLKPQSIIISMTIRSEKEELPAKIAVTLG